MLFDNFTKTLINKCEFQAVNTACDLLYSSSIFSRPIFSALLEFLLVIGIYLFLIIFVKKELTFLAPNASTLRSVGASVVYFFGFKDVYMPLVWFNLEQMYSTSEVLIMKQQTFYGILNTGSPVVQFADLLVFWNG